jgi:negative regulator of flagellin synthesis FlgM
MNTTISSNGLPQLPLPANNADSSASQASTSSTSTSSSAPLSDDSVQLTDSARALQQASSTDSPVDSERVEQIRKSLAAGTYQVSPNAIADRLTSLESQISGTK